MKIGPRAGLANDRQRHLLRDSLDRFVAGPDFERGSGWLDRLLAPSDPALRAVPVIIVSYKEREQDRLRGLEVGASYYLTKSSFHDNTFLQAVTDLIGEA